MGRTTDAILHFLPQVPSSHFASSSCPSSEGRREVLYFLFTFCPSIGCLERAIYDFTRR